MMSKYVYKLQKEKTNVYMSMHCCAEFVVQYPVELLLLMIPNGFSPIDMNLHQWYFLYSIHYHYK